MSNFRILILAGLVVATTGCETLIPANPQSFKLEGERVSIEVLKPSDSKITNSQGVKEAAPAIAAVVIPLVADYAIKKVSGALDDETKKYTAVYNGTRAAADFYSSAGPSPTLNFGGLKIVRTILKDGKEATASEITLSVDSSQQTKNGQLQLVGDTAIVNYSKAKVADSRWYLPWTLFQCTRKTIDIDINIIIEAHWIDDKGNSKRDDIADLNLGLRGIELGATTDISKSRSEWFPLLPRTKTQKEDKSTLTGTGTYVLKAKVNEFDDYGKRVKALSDFVSSNKSDWISKIKDSLK